MLNTFSCELEMDPVCLFLAGLVRALPIIANVNQLLEFRGQEGRL
jgi:hypothetical protein